MKISYETYPHGMYKVLDADSATMLTNVLSIDMETLKIISTIEPLKVVDGEIAETSFYASRVHIDDLNRIIRIYK